MSPQEILQILSARLQEWTADPLINVSGLDWWIPGREGITVRVRRAVTGLPETSFGVALPAPPIGVVSVYQSEIAEYISRQMIGPLPVTLAKWYER